MRMEVVHRLLLTLTRLNSVVECAAVVWFMRPRSHIPRRHRDVPGSSLGGGTFNKFLTKDMAF